MALCRCSLSKLSSRREPSGGLRGGGGASSLRHLTLGVSGGLGAGRFFFLDSAPLGILSSRRECRDAPLAPPPPPPLDSCPARSRLSPESPAKRCGTLRVLHSCLMVSLRAPRELERYVFNPGGRLDSLVQAGTGALDGGGGCEVPDWCEEDAGEVKDIRKASEITIGVLYQHDIWTLHLEMIM